MNKPTKITLLALLLLLALPMRHFAQTPYRQYSEEGVVLNFHTIDNVYFRSFLLYNISNDNRFVLIPEETFGQFIITPKYDDSHFMDEFESFYANVETDFSLLSKIDITNLMSVWKSSVEATDYLSIMMDVNTANLRSDNDHCLNSMPFCTSEVIEFEAAYQGGATGEPGPEYGCLSSQPYPSWYHMRIHTAGQFIIHMEAHDASGQGHDIDYCIWGPFTDPYEPCVNGLTCDKMIDCSYSTSSVENVYLGYPISQHNHGSSSLADGSCVTANNNPPHTPQVGEYYILMITNFSQYQQTISFTKTPNSGPGETDCGILPGVVENDGPYCVGETIHLTVSSQNGATYSWSGPGGWTSTQQNPTRPNCTMNMAGTYTCTTTVGAQTTTGTTEVVIYPMPNANFTFNTVCQGNPTQFTNTSTTNPAGQQITSYQWNFGDGQTSTQQSPSHTYTNAGTYPVILTISTGGHCTSTKTQNVTVTPQPVANAGPDQTIPYGSIAQLNGSGGAGTFNYHWEPANMVTNPNAQNTQTVILTEDQTYTLTVSNESCTSTDEVTIHISGSAMTVTAGPDISICQGGSGQIYVSAGGGTGNLTYSWTPTTGLSNPNIYNPIASPSQTTTYTCHVTDGQTSQNVSVTVTVNDVIVDNEYMSICPSDIYYWHGDPYTAVGTYQFDTVTSQGCDKTIYLHLDHYPTYDETTIDVAICHGESYNFYGTNYTSSIQTSYTDHTTQHGCDSIVRLNLTVYPDNGVTPKPVTVCPEQLPYNFYGVDYFDNADVTYLDTDVHGCDSAVRLILNVSDYYMPEPQVSHTCSLPFEWVIKDADNNVISTQYITVPGIHTDTLPTNACEGIFQLDLRYQPVPEPEHIYDTACNNYRWFIDGQLIDEYQTTTEDEYHISQYPYPCSKDYYLHLIVNHDDSDVTYYDGNNPGVPCDSIPFDWFGNAIYFKENDTYNFSTSLYPEAHTTHGCDTAMVVHVSNMTYTPNPNNIKCSDASAVVYSVDPLNPNVDDTIAVVTNTEFFSFQYTFYVEETNSNCKWESCNWAISKPSWAIEPMPMPTLSLNGKYYSECTVYVADRQNEYVELTATINNGCGSKERKFYLKSSFLDVEEYSNMPAKVNIVPNPNNGQMHIDFENMEGRTTVNVFDMTGNQIDAFETVVNSNRYNYEYNMKKYAEGIYFFVISNNNRVLTKKVVVIH